MPKVEAGSRTLWGRTTPFPTDAVAKARASMKRGSAFNVRIFQRTNGWIGSRWRIGRKFLRGIPVCLLTTTGRRSGQARISPLLFLQRGPDTVVVASQGGMPRHPDWYHNLVADPAVRLHLPHQAEFAATAHVVDDDERAALWPELVELYPSFAVYQARAERVIPVIVCSPVS